MLKKLEYILYESIEVESTSKKLMEVWRHKLKYYEGAALLIVSKLAFSSNLNPDGGRK